MKERDSLFSAFVHFLWGAAVAAALISGLAHLPLAYRYGLIDTWNTSPTLIHYWAAAALLFLCAYVSVVWFASGRRRCRLTVWGRARALLVAVLVVSGLVLVLHNLQNFSIHGAAYAGFKLAHLASGVLLLLFLIARFSARALGRGRCCVPRQRPRGG